MLIDFKEIPKANDGSGVQDTFELFARDFLADIGYVIVQEPDRGADGKKDIIVKELRKGIAGITEKLWLVSCKHFIHSGKSVTQDDEPDILDRVNAHHCDGFIGFYSTLPAASLSNKLSGLQSQIETQTYDREKIEKRLLDSISGNKLAERYFPNSYKNYKRENPTPADLYADQSSIHCDNCGEDLLRGKKGIYVLLEDMKRDHDKPSHTKGIYFSCKGKCDETLRYRYRAKGLMDAGWDDLPDVTIPTVFLYKLNTIINTLISGETYEKEAIDRIKFMFISCLPYISRDLTTDEKKRLEGLMRIPSWAGGMGG